MLRCASDVAMRWERVVWLERMLVPCHVISPCHAYDFHVFPPCQVRPDQVELIRRDYMANGGWETFLAYEDPRQDILIGLLRLRKCSPQTFRPELTTQQSSIVRELHV